MYKEPIDATTKTIIHTDSNNQYNGLCIEDRVRHIQIKHLAYEQYQFNEANNIRNANLLLLFNQRRNE